MSVSLADIRQLNLSISLSHTHTHSLSFCSFFLSLSFSFCFLLPLFSLSISSLESKWNQWFLISCLKELLANYQNDVGVTVVVAVVVVAVTTAFLRISCASLVAADDGAANKKNKICRKWRIMIFPLFGSHHSFCGKERAVRVLRILSFELFK